MIKSLIVVFLSAILFPVAAQGASPSLCPEKVLDTNQIEGIYQGVECGGDFCYASLTLDNGDDFILMCGEEQGEDLFGLVGNRVSVTYEIQQFWNEPGGMCSREEVVTDGRILKGSPAPPKIPNPSFDCKAAKTTIEKAICGDYHLAAQDRQMAEHYSELRAKAADKQALISDQRRFLASRKECESSPDLRACLSSRYIDRDDEIMEMLLALSEPTQPDSSPGVQADNIQAPNNPDLNWPQGQINAGSSPVKLQMRRQSNGGAVLSITSLENSLTIRQVTVNRGNCRTFVSTGLEEIVRTDMEAAKKIATLLQEIQGEMMLGLATQDPDAVKKNDANIKKMVEMMISLNAHNQLPQVLKFGQLIEINTFGPCNVIETTVDTNRGNWTFNFD